MEASNLTASQAQNLSDPTAASGLSLPYQQEFYLTIKILAPVLPVITCFGLCSNITNIVVFLKAGAKDNVTVLLLCLAISDLVFLILMTPSNFRFIILALVPSFSFAFHPFILQSLFYWPAQTVYDLSAFISVSLGVVRCACVAMPLKFKLVFTKSRTVKWVMFLVIFAILLRSPVLTIHRLSWVADPGSNVSSLTVVLVDRETMSRINDILNRGFIVNMTYATMVTCVAILFFKIRQAAKIRRSCTGKPLQASGKPSPQGLSTKDLQVVKSVVLVCTIFILLQLPFLLLSIIRLVDPEVDNQKRLLFLFGIFGRVNATCSHVNASVNIFIYYNYNSKYRSVLKALISVKRTKQ
ncbi:chemosensory receptor A [Elysia marginata]|uniref:Chemosensory receptor A n=1 Tax=Elysia marginata TaxID=1093978 RepID=A0AAV4FLG6_9GAST|nr:chemosensory receptor A [Elysia marginata]